MSTDSQAGARAPRLNPFTFPSDTDFRFALLIVAVLGSSLLIYLMMYHRIPGNWERMRVIGEQCREAAEASYPGDSLEDSIARTDAFSQCMAPVYRVQDAWMLGGVVLLLVVAGLIYWFFPVWKIRRAELVPLSAEDAPEVVAYLENLCREAELSHVPNFVWNPLNPASSGLAFGRLGRYWVSLTGGLITQFYTDRPAFRAVMLHELAHLRNGDVDKTYFTVAVWWAFVACVLVPFAVTEPFALIQYDRPWRVFLNHGWRLLILAALVYLTRNAVLRVREVYADVRASVWDGPTGALRRVLASLPHRKGDRWRYLLQMHPDPGERRRALDDTDQMFRMGFWDAFGTGIAATVAFMNVETLMSGLIRSSWVFLHPLGSALIFAPLAVGVVGLGVWRGTFAALARGKPPRGAGRLGLALGLGAIVGQASSFSAYALAKSELGLTDTALIVREILWNCLLLTSLFLFFRWVACGASTWLEVAAAGRSPRLFYRLGLAIAGGLLALWLAFLFYAYPGAASFTWSSVVEAMSGIVGTDLSGPKATGLFIAAGLGFVVMNPLTLLACISLWAFPLAAWFWRKRVASSSAPDWASLDPAPQPLTLPRQAPLRPARALTVGLIGGAAFCAFALVLGLGPRLARPEVFAGWVLFGQPALAALMQVGVAIVVAGWVRRLGGLHGLFAAFVAGCVMTGGVLAFNLWLGGIEMLLDSWFQVSAVFNGGALLALPAALTLSALTRRFHRWRVQRISRDE